MTYWLSTKTPVHAFRPSYRTYEADKFLRETVGVDAAILAVELHISTTRVEAYQRQLGLRKLTGHKRRGKPLHDSL